MGILRLEYVKQRTVPGYIAQKQGGYLTAPGPITRECWAVVASAASRGPPAYPDNAAPRSRRHTRKGAAFRHLKACLYPGFTSNQVLFSKNGRFWLAEEDRRLDPREGYFWPADKDTLLNDPESCCLPTRM